MAHMTRERQRQRETEKRREKETERDRKEERERERSGEIQRVGNYVVPPAFKPSRAQMRAPHTSIYIYIGVPFPLWRSALCQSLSGRSPPAPRSVPRQGQSCKPSPTLKKKENCEAAVMQSCSL